MPKRRRHPAALLFTFKAELDGLMTVLKLVIHIRHMLQELLPDFTIKGVIFSYYNEALVNFVNGNGPVRHIEIHQWLTRDAIQKVEFQ